MNDLDIYRLEAIQEEMDDLLDEADAIISGSNDQLIVDRARNLWIFNIRVQLRGMEVVTMEKTIRTLWDKYYEKR